MVVDGDLRGMLGLGEKSGGGGGGNDGVEI